MRYELRRDGVTLVRRPTRLQCVIEAYERGLAVACRGAESLVDGVEIIDRWADGASQMERADG